MLEAPTTRRRNISFAPPPPLMGFAKTRRSSSNVAAVESRSRRCSSVAAVESRSRRELSVLSHFDSDDFDSDEYDDDDHGSQTPRGQRTPIEFIADIESAGSLRDDLKVDARHRGVAMAETAQRSAIEATMRFEFDHLCAAMCARNRESFERGLVAAQCARSYNRARLVDERSRKARRRYLGYAPHAPLPPGLQIPQLQVVPRLRRTSSLPALPTAQLVTCVPRSSRPPIAQPHALRKGGGGADDGRAEQGVRGIAHATARARARADDGVEADVRCVEDHRRVQRVELAVPVKLPSIVSNVPDVTVAPMRSRRRSLSAPALKPPPMRFDTCLVAGRHRQGAPLPEAKAAQPPIQHWWQGVTSIH
jgi:hypothetical protein